jgi:hypothetical protein
MASTEDVRSPPRAPGSWQELGEEFHLMIGECIAGWAHVDDELFRIFHHCVGPLVQCAIIYYRTPGLDVRFGLVDEIVGSVLPKREPRSGGKDHPSVRAWKTAKGNYQSLLGVRRRIAHHPVQIQHFARYYGDAPPLSWFEVYVNNNERLREKEANIPPLRIDDLRSHLVNVDRLSGRLHQFYYDVLIKRHEETPLPVPSQSP